VTPGGAVRAFLALEIPPAVRARIAQEQAQLKKEMPGARWTRPEGQHLTLKFLGEISPSALEGLVNDLGPRLNGLGSVSVSLGGSGFFPSQNRPRVAWVGGSIEGVEPVVAAVEAAGKIAGFAREKRTWSLHLTQARLRKPWPRVAVDHFLEWGETLRIESFVCHEVILFKSDLQPGGAVYTALERMPLR